MVRTTAQAFDHFYDNYIKPSDAQRSDVTSKRISTENYLSSAFPASSDMPLSNVRLIGSAARSTHVRPVDDIDVLAVFSNENGAYDNYRWKSGDFLQRIRRALDADTSIQRIGARGQAVRLFYVSGAHVDIAPGFARTGGGYLIPSGDGSWIMTNPQRHTEWMSERRTEIGNNLSRVVRLAKRWNAQHSSNFQSFHLEVLIASMFSSLGSNSREALKIFFQSGAGWIDVSDPAGHSGLLSDYLSYQTRSQIKSRLSSAAERAEKAIASESAGDHAESKRLWAIELGDQFPTS